VCVCLTLSVPICVRAVVHVLLSMRLALGWGQTACRTLPTLASARTRSRSLAMSSAPDFALICECRAPCRPAARCCRIPPHFCPRVAHSACFNERGAHLRLKAAWPVASALAGPVVAYALSRGSRPPKGPVGLFRCFRVSRDQLLLLPPGLVAASPTIRCDPLGHPWARTYHFSAPTHRDACLAAGNGKEQAVTVNSEQLLKTFPRGPYTTARTHQVCHHL